MFQSPRARSANPSLEVYSRLTHCRSLSYTAFALTHVLFTYSGGLAMLGTCRTHVVILSVFVVGFMNSCGVRRQMNEMKALEDCEFRYEGLQHATLAGVNVSTIESVFNLRTDEASTLFTALAYGSMPLEGTVSVGVRNPTMSAAAMNRLEWVLLIDDVEVGTGAVTDRIDIPAGGGTATIPISFSTDLIRLLSDKSGDAIINFGLNLAGTADQPSRLTVKVKPTVLIGKKSVQYPGYITLTREFSDGMLK